MMDACHVSNPSQSDVEQAREDFFQTEDLDNFEFELSPPQNSKMKMKNSHLFKIILK